MAGPRIAATPRGVAVALLLALSITACRDSSPPPARVASTPVDLTTAGQIRVQVLYRGEPPKRAELNLQSAPQCAEAHPDPVLDPSLVVDGGHLLNAVVWIKSGFGDRPFAPPETHVVLDQRGCMYHPHVAAAMVGQTVEFINSDTEVHNVHGHPDVGRSWNFIMSRKGSSRTLTFDREEVAIPVSCDIHPWMQAYLAVVANPYFGVTGNDGAVILKPVPPGDYTVGVWHEKLGTKEQKVKLDPKGTAELQFSYP